MKIKNVEIITIQDLVRPSRMLRRRNFRLRLGFLLKNVQNRKPQKSPKLYSDSFGKYELFSNFFQGRGVSLLNQKAKDILNIADGNKTIKDILEELSLKKGDKLEFSDAWLLRKDSFKEALTKLKSGKEILTLENLARIFLVFSQNGLIYNLKSPQANYSSEQLKAPLETFFYLTNEPYLSYQSDQYPFAALSAKREAPQGLKAIDAIFDFAQKENYKQILIRFFVGKSEEYPLLKELVAYSKRKSMEYFIDSSFSLFTNWTLINQSFIRDIRQMRTKLILPLDGIGETYDKVSHFLKREGNFKNVEKALHILDREKYSPFFISTITSLNLDGFQELTYFLLEKKLNFIFGFIQKHSLVPKELLPDQEKLTEIILRAYKTIEKKLPPHPLFQNILGRNFPLFGRSQISKYHPLIVTGKEIKKIDFKLKESKNCLNCQFKGLCLKSFPVITSHFSLERDNLSDYCQVYKKLIPQALKLEAKRLIKYKK